MYLTMIVMAMGHRTTRVDSFTLRGQPGVKGSLGSPTQRTPPFEQFGQPLRKCATPEIPLIGV